MLMTQLQLFPGGGDTLGLNGTRLWVGLGGNFVLGVLMMLGIGLYAPCMILVSLLGMNPTAAFPIMMGSCAFLMPIEQREVRAVAAAITCRRRSASRSAAVPGVLIAGVHRPRRCRSAPSAGSSSCVVVYTSLNMLATARREEEDGDPDGVYGNA